MRKVILIGLYCLALMGCVNTAQHQITDWSNVDAGPKPNLEKIKPEVENFIKYQREAVSTLVNNGGSLVNEYQSLIDPESAQFSDWQPLHKDLNNWLVSQPIEGVWRGCVRVNAKNRMGGYTGPKYYWYKVKNGYVFEWDEAGCFTPSDSSRFVE